MVANHTEDNEGACPKGALCSYLTHWAEGSICLVCGKVPLFFHN
jgi:hypothetical protein